MPAVLCLAAALALAGCTDDNRAEGARGPRGSTPDGTSASRQAGPGSGGVATGGGTAAGPATSPTPAAPAPPPQAGPAGPCVALVIDDLGLRLTGPAADLLALPIRLTLAVLPGLPHSGEVAALAAGSGGERELLLHLPMQPLDYPQTDPGPGALLLGQEGPEVAARLDRALAWVPGATGVNNHMGSAATADSLLMASLMEALAARGLRFLDSLTTSRSVAGAAARRAGVPYAANRLFLDVDHRDEAAISARLAELVGVARRSGSAIGIAHPHPATAAVLVREVPRYAAEGIRFTTVSGLPVRSSQADPGVAAAVSDVAEVADVPEVAEVADVTGEHAGGLQGGAGGR